MYGLEWLPIAQREHHENLIRLQETERS